MEAVSRSFRFIAYFSCSDAEPVRGRACRIRLAVLRRAGRDSVVSRLSLPYSRLRTLMVRKTRALRATSDGAAHYGSGIGSRPVWAFRHRAKRP